MYTTFEDYSTNISLHNVYMIFGEEGLLIDDLISKIQQFISKYPNSTYDYEIIDTDKVSIDKIKDICSSYPLVCDRKFVIIRNFEKLVIGKASKKTSNDFILKNIIENPPSFLNLIITANLEKVKDLKKNLKGKELSESGVLKLKDIKYPFDFIIKNKSWIEFPRVYEKEYPNWVINKVKENSKIINLKAAQLLCLQVRSSLRDLDAEIEKLLLYSKDKNEITEDDIYDLTGTTKEYNVFELQKAIAIKDLNKSITILNKILSNDEQEILIVSVLLKFFINMFKFVDLFSMISDENVLAKEMGMQKWQLSDYLVCKNKYQSYEIDNAIIELTECDFKLKSTNTNTIALLQNSIIRILGNK
ncbi:MAG TPA: DNA polymerase III subunit delta [Candidatus Kapabacteria bacterium]|nr:DNA polymerase III subunit delta [Candidatus Kapabacteria bacterium]